MAEQRLADALQGAVSVSEILVRWGDMDAYGHVNNTVYFRYMETARIALFDRSDVQDALRGTPIGPVLRETRCRFKAPVMYPDTLHVGVWVDAIEADRFMTRYVMFSRAHGRVVAEGDAHVVLCDLGTGRPAPMPDALRELLEQDAG